MLTVPVAADLEYQALTVLLDSVEYVVELRWNARAAAWIFSLSTADGVRLVGGRRCAVGAPLLVRSADARLPLGELVAIDTSGRDVEPGLGDLGRRVELVYLSPADLSAPAPA